MELSPIPAEYRWKARKCRFLVKSSTEEAVAKSLMFLANEYEAAATSIERKAFALAQPFRARACPVPGTLWTENAVFAKANPDYSGVQPANC